MRIGPGRKLDSLAKGVSGKVMACSSPLASDSMPRNWCAFVGRAGQSPALPHRLVLLLQLPPEPLRGAGERGQALCQVQIDVVVAGEKAFGQILRDADGVGEVQCGRAHGGEDVLAHQPAGVFVYDVAARICATQLFDMLFKVPRLPIAR